MLNQPLLDKYPSNQNKKENWSDRYYKKYVSSIIPVELEFLDWEPWCKSIMEIS